LTDLALFPDGMNGKDGDRDAVLYGADPVEGIVAANLAGRFVRIFIRTGKGVVFHDDPFRPFILLESRDLLEGFGKRAELKPLSGDGAFRFMAVFSDWSDCVAAKAFLAGRSGKTPTASGAPYLFLSDPVHQHLLLTGKTFFKGLGFSSLRRMAVDIETDCGEGYEFSNPSREGDRIISVAVKDSTGYEEVLSGEVMSEPEMLERLGEIIRARDPDVLEGHNIFRFDLDYIRARAARLGVRLCWGRDGSEPKFSQSRFTVAEKTIDYPRCDIYGRSVVDTYFLVLLHDVASRDMESHGLKSAARYFGLAGPERVYLPGDSLARVWRESPELLARYNLDDVRETLALSGLLSHSYFLQARIFPYSFQSCIVRGNATRINSLFLREYLRRGVAIPRPPGGGEPFEGGYADVFIHGVVGPVVHCDVASLYPSLLLSSRLKPAADSLDLFLPLLSRLRSFRLSAKRRAKEGAAPSVREHFSALQQAFKVLINSFYGYLGSSLHNFSDPAVAGRVARLGRDTIRFMMERLQAWKARVVELDTDGVYFIPPPGMDSPEAWESLVAGLSTELPEGIDVEMDGIYRAMFSYKSKNYALLGYDGGITVKGSALRSRGTEKYLREFTSEVIRLLLLGEERAVEEVYGEFQRRLREHHFDISWIAKTETLHESPDTYRGKVSRAKRNPSAAYEIAARSSHEYRAGDQIAYYITGRGKSVTSWENCRSASGYDPLHPDENTEFYLEKLRQARKRFEPFEGTQGSLF